MLLQVKFPKDKPVIQIFSCFIHSACLQEQNMNCHNLDESHVLNLSRKMPFSDDRLRKTASPSLLSTL